MHSEAEFRLALCCRNGIYFEADPGRAFNHCLRASKHGHAAAIAELPAFRASVARELLPCHLPDCDRVEQTRGEFLMCSGCRRVQFCSVECQRAHWLGGHRFVCARICQKQ